MVQFGYFPNMPAYFPTDQEDLFIHISQAAEFEGRLVRILDDNDGIVSIVSEVPSYKGQTTMVIIGNHPYFLVDGPYHNRADAEAYLNGKELEEDNIAEAKAFGVI